ncbi:hypothetical protein PUN28_007777 [Cardiocondyla obscurior]|uniref:Uncharacterized protein n=1 Tax=Cardiocondyla obscurior TaxID=286306 RepID=A0AAW2FWH3_9HYME
MLFAGTSMTNVYDKSAGDRRYEILDCTTPQRVKVLQDRERKELLATELAIRGRCPVGNRMLADIRILECQGEFSLLSADNRESNNLITNFGLLVEIILKKLCTKFDKRINV